MAEPKNVTGSGAVPWPMVIVTVLVMVGASALALLLIPQLSMPAAVRGGSIAIGAFLLTQIGWRVYARYKQRGNRG